MRGKVKISVIMSVYNPTSREHLKKAVLSIVHQSFQEWELILYDDGSEKEEAEFIRRTAGMDERILYIRGSGNRGLAYALNVCIAHAAGKYIARMDADDLSAKERLAVQYRFLETHPRYQWAGSNAELIDGHGVWGLQRVPERPEKRDFLLYSPYIHPSVMFRKSVLQKYRGYCASGALLQCEDYELFMKLHRNGQRGYNIQEPLLQYRETYNSYQRRGMLRRYREMRLRFHGFRKLGLKGPDVFFSVVRPFAAGMIPVPIHYHLRRKRNEEYKNTGKKTAVSERFKRTAAVIPGGRKLPSVSGR